MRQIQSLMLFCVNEEPWALGREGGPAWEGGALAGNQAHSGLAGGGAGGCQLGGCVGGPGLEPLQ